MSTDPFTTATDDLSTLNDFVRWGASLFNEHQLFFGHGTDNAIDEAMVLVLHALHLQANPPESFWSARLTRSEKNSIIHLFQQRINARMPVPYLTHEAWFAGLSFYVDQRVLIPRSPFAELIQHQFSPWLEAEDIHQVLELGTGSGCIAIATALALPHSQVDAVDISPDALQVARKNISDYGLEHQVQAIESNLFSQLSGQRYDLIIANPPYVDAQEMHDLPPEYRHEPELGLAAGEDGLDLVHHIIKQATNHLNPGGVLIVEVGASEQAMIETYPDLALTWLEFEQGGSGVFLIRNEDLSF
ncbi:50S ribosomal protein L3 N(5)-glutamine methyltransferase [Candidatus Venteria ishoeyi]|uniref:50S ribosomal protein L3 N(5)-glutamine methyltransferase n=1 Tax=Candidatus Venteria ishoeyi TaxID=1899563 RepID=UPI0025A57C62|nr:50S ribosomal protein L3 N(5)-glutamine methyltransferase [Candidatus Venteria ishoeyi]MDM8546037.1 50S ribosomal protein L3 N(5)-glutamine methyltransferase [Candidatus Venteria ishoeyi]